MEQHCIALMLHSNDTSLGTGPSSIVQTTLGLNILQI